LTNFLANIYKGDGSILSILLQDNKTKDLINNEEIISNPKQCNIISLMQHLQYNVFNHQQKQTFSTFFFFS